MACQRVQSYLVQLIDFIDAANNLEEDKYRRESLAVDYLSCLLKTSNHSAAVEIKSLFEEFEAGESPEARFVREIDAFECLVQAEEYEDRAEKPDTFLEFVGLESRISSTDLGLWTKLLAQERSAISAKKSTDTIIIFVIGKHHLYVYDPCRFCH
jgi:5'-deoxynucleotidase YfbR-like HD superfamily hydrolase